MAARFKEEIRMAKYGINKEGVDALNQLANDLSSINNDEIEINKTKYKIKLIKYDSNGDEITLKLLYEEK